MHFHTDRTAHTTAFDGPVGDNWLEQNIAQTANASTVQDPSNDPNFYRQVPYWLSYVPFPNSLTVRLPCEGKSAFSRNFAVGLIIST